MSGVFGVVDERRCAAVPALVEQMAGRLRHCAWHVTETTADPLLGVGLGRAGIGIFNREPQPWRSDDGALDVVFTGLLFDTKTVRHQLTTRGVMLRSTRAEELIAELYRQYGRHWAAHVTGEFVAAIWDRERRELLLSNDRLGFYPTYYAYEDHRLLFAPEMKAILGAPGFRKQLDRSALAEYMRFQVLLGERTFFEGIALLPDAAVLHYALGGDSLSVSRYWSLAEVGSAPAVSFDDAVDECDRLLARAVNRLPARGYRTGLYLSGGLDSRLLLAMIEPRHMPVTTFTFGHARSRDVVYARRVARRSAARHLCFPLQNGAWVAEHADLHLALTEGFHSWIHAHGISTLAQARERADVALSGFGGGTVVKNWLSRIPLMRELSDDVDVMTAHQFQLFNQVYTWPGLAEAEERVLYTDTWWKNLQGRAFESLRVQVIRAMEWRPDLRAEFLYMRSHDFRLTLHFHTILRSHIEVLSPFFDYDLFRFIHSLPAAQREYRALAWALLRRRAPDLCRVPDARDDLPPMPGLVRSIHRVAKRLRSAANTHVAPIFPDYLTLYADYESYARTDLRVWVEDLLFGSRTAARGLFNPVFLRSLWERLQSRREPDMIGKLAPIMTYESMLRSLYDPA